MSQIFFYLCPRYSCMSKKGRILVIFSMFSTFDTDVSNTFAYGC